VNGLAPETIADGITYHLGLPNEYLRLGGFPDHITFYDMVPQGMEMLYTVAFAFGRHAAAKLVEFAFLLATIPSFPRGQAPGRERSGVPCGGGILLLRARAGITGASSYNDAAGVFFLLAAFYLLLLADSRYLFGGRRARRILLRHQDARRAGRGRAPCSSPPRSAAGSPYSSSPRAPR